MSKHSDDLTRAEAAFLRSSAVPASVREYAAQTPAKIAVRTSAYRKVAAAARAERDAIVEVVALNVVRARAEGRALEADRAARLEDEARSLQQALDQTRARLAAATAAPALAVYAEGTGR